MIGRRRTQVASRTRARRGLALALVAVTVALAACSSDDDGGGGDEGDDQVSEDQSSGPQRGADVAEPTVSGPVTGGERDQAFNAMPADLADEYGYVEEEFFLEGEATAFQVEGELGEDGRWTVSPGGTADYRTRVIVRRPADAGDFDGTVFVEWLNVSGGVDSDPDFSMIHPELLGHGSAYVGVSAQQVGVEGGPSAVPIEIPGVEVQALKQWDPERYGDLSHPGDQYSYDIFSQAAQAVRRPGDVDVLDGMEASHVIAVGESQSAARMVSYVDAVQPVADIFDGFLVHSRGGGGAPLDDSASILGEGTARIRDDLDVPVFQFLTETDLFGVLGFARARQDDSDRLRTWEVAGTAHADRSILDYNADMAEQAGVGNVSFADQCGSINAGPQALVLRAAVAALRAWVVDGEAPPEAPRLESEGEALARDEHGIALGGIRTPAVDAPVAVHTGEAPPGGSIFCMLFGQSTPFDDATLAQLYASHDEYVTAVDEAAGAAVEAGFLLQDDADDLVAEAEEAAVP
jgi:alpha/beta hydrolase family protein